MSIVVSDPILIKLFCIKYSYFKEHLVKFQSNLINKKSIWFKSRVYIIFQIFILKDAT